jgi:hypothetical protein
MPRSSWLAFIGTTAGPGEGGNHVPNPFNTTTSPLPTPEQFEQLVRLANNGDQDALQKMRNTLDAAPSVWQMVGDLGRHTQSRIMQRICGGDSLALQSLARRVEQMKIELARKTPTPLEKLAVDRVISCWLWLQFAENELATTLDPTPAQGKFLRTQRLQLDRMFQTASKSLADLQRLGPLC